MFQRLTRFFIQARTPTMKTIFFKRRNKKRLRKNLSKIVRPSKICALLVVISNKQLFLEFLDNIEKSESLKASIIKTILAKRWFRLTKTIITKKCWFNKTMGTKKCSQLTLQRTILTIRTKVSKIQLKRGLS